MSHEVTKCMFLGSRKCIDNEEFLKICDFRGTDPDEVRIQCTEWFKDFVRQGKEETLRSLLQFSTCFEDLSAFGDKHISLDFLVDEKMPRASAFTGTLLLPMVANDK